MAELDPAEKRHATLLISAQTATKLGDVLTDPKTVLTWLLSALGAPGAALSMLVPVRESGSMLPQLFISDRVKRVSRRKWVFVGGALAQALAVAAMGAAAWWLEPAPAGWAVLGALALFAVARAFCSISSKDVVGRTIPKGFRGRIGGIANTISGVLSAAAAVWLLLRREQAPVDFLAAVVLGASLLWLLGAALFALIREPLPEDKDGTQDAEGWIERLALVRDDALFRRFVLARGLLAGSALASPLLVVLAQRGDGALASLVGFVIAAGIAKTTSSFLWGKLADRAARLSMAAGGFTAAAFGAASILVAWRLPAADTHPALWPALFLGFNVGYAGVRLGRKTWVIDAVEGDRRTDYVSASNTLIAVLILGLGALNAPLQAWAPLASLAAYTLLCLAGAALALRLDRDAG